MSKETTVIVLGLWIIVLPYLGIPGGWRTTLIVLTGIALMGLGFILRGEALGRGSHAKHSSRNSFVENMPASQADAPAHDHSAHDHKERITSLN
jgi:hypothetical protein